MRGRESSASCYSIKYVQIDTTLAKKTSSRLWECAHAAKNDNSRLSFLTTATNTDDNRWECFQGRLKGEQEKFGGHTKMQDFS